MTTILIIISILLVTLIGVTIHSNIAIEKRFNKLEGNVKTPTNVLVATLPSTPTIQDVDPNLSIIQDVIESVKLENWSGSAKADYKTFMPVYTIEYSNPTNSVKISSRVYLDSNSSNPNLKTIHISKFNIISTNSTLAFDDKTLSPTTLNIVSQFVWEKILENHIALNKQTRDSYEASLNDIRSKLTTLNRDRKINSLNS